MRLFALSVLRWSSGCLCGGQFVSFWELDRRMLEDLIWSVVEKV